MMKKTIMFVGILGIMAFMGCAQKEFVFTQKPLCSSPIVDVLLQGSDKKGDQGVMDEDELNVLLKQITQNTGCIRLVDSAKEGVFTLNATFETKLAQEEEKGTFKSKINNVLITRATLQFNNQKIIRRDFGESKILVQENKVLGVGQEGKISQEEEKKAIQSSILAALQSFIKAAKAGLGQSEEPTLERIDVTEICKDC